MNAQRVGVGMLVLAVALGILGWLQLEPGTLTVLSVTTAPPAVQPAEVPAVAATRTAAPPAPPRADHAPLKLGVQPRADRARPQPMPPCSAAVKRHETVERLAGVIVLVSGDLKPYAEAYANAATAQVPSNCGVPPLNADRHRRALDVLRARRAMEPAKLDVVQTALGV